MSAANDKNPFYASNPARGAYLKALFNFIRNNLDAQLQNPCDTPMLKKLFRPGKLAQWQIPEK